MRWYISHTAVTQYARIADTTDLARAERELADLADAARLVRDADDRQRHQMWRATTRINGRKTRLEFAVSIEHRPEGDLPQLIHVRDKGA